MMDFEMQNDHHPCIIFLLHICIRISYELSDQFPIKIGTVSPLEDQLKRYLYALGRYLHLKCLAEIWFLVRAAKTAVATDISTLAISRDNRLPLFNNENECFCESFLLFSKKSFLILGKLANV